MKKIFFLLPLLLAFQNSTLLSYSIGWKLKTGLICRFKKPPSQPTGSHDDSDSLDSVLCECFFNDPLPQNLNQTVPEKKSIRRFYSPFYNRNHILFCDKDGNYLYLQPKSDTEGFFVEIDESMLKTNDIYFVFAMVNPPFKIKSLIQLIAKNLEEKAQTILKEIIQEKLNKDFPDHKRNHMALLTLSRKDLK